MCIVYVHRGEFVAAMSRSSSGEATDVRIGPMQSQDIVEPTVLQQINYL